MIPFQFKMWFETLTRPVEGDRFTERSVRRVFQRFAMLTLFPLYELFNAACLALDYVFFPGFKRQPIVRPVQVIGNPRSGTTFLHRVLALDEENFITTRMWQMMFPALTQQWVVRKLAALDRALGSPVYRLLVAVQNRALKGADKYHKIRFEVPEEDEGYFVHPFASGFLAMLFPRDEWNYYQKLDEMPAEDRIPLMSFYRECIRRILYQDPQGRGLLSKNPLFNSKVASLYEFFPDIRVVYVVRNPAEMLCSVQNLLLNFWLAQGLELPEGASLQRPGLIEWATYNYQHVIEVLDKAPPESYAIVRYDDLVADPKGTIEKLYARLGIPMTPTYQKILEAEAARARKYESRHEYSLEKFDLTHAQIEAALPFVYDRYQFPRVGQLPAGGEGPQP